MSARNRGLSVHDRDKLRILFSILAPLGFKAIDLLRREKNGHAAESSEWTLWWGCQAKSVH